MLNDSILASLTGTYLQCLIQEWSVVRVGEAQLPFTQVYTPGRVLSRRGVAGGRGAVASIPLLQAAGQAPRLVLSGAPGIGKTTSLQFLGLAFAQADSLPEAWRASGDRLVPVSLRLTGAPDEPSIEAQLAEAIPSLLGEATRLVSGEMVEEWAHQGRLLVLLDGLDEAPANAVPALRSALRKFLESPTGQAARLILAAGPDGFPAPGNTFQEFSLQPLNGDGEGIENAIRGWISALDGTALPEELEQQAADIARSLSAQPTLQRAAGNPQILRLVVENYPRSGLIRPTRTLIFADNIALPWRLPGETAGATKTPDSVLESLENLAWNRQTGHDLLPIDKAHLDQRFIYVGSKNKPEQGQSSLAFSHLSFQHFFAARRLARMWAKDAQAAWVYIKPRLHLPGWRETILFFTGLLDQSEGQARRLVEGVLSAHSPYESILHRDLLLAAGMVSECHPDHRKVRDKVIRQARSLLIKPWGRNRASLAARLVAVQALQQVGMGDAIQVLSQALLQDPSERVRRSAAQALGELASPKGLRALSRALRDKKDRVRQAAITALGHLGTPQAIQAIATALQDLNPGVRRACIETLGRIPAEDRTPLLVKGLNDPDEWAGLAAAEVLARSGTAEGQAALAAALGDPEGNAFFPAASVLIRDGHTEARAAVYHAFKSPQDKVRSRAVKILGQAAGPEEISFLQEAMRDPDWRVRRSAVESLSTMKSELAQQALCQALHDPEWWVRLKAAQGLGSLGELACIPALREALDDPERRVARAAAEALMQIGAEEIMPDMYAGLEDPDPYIQRGAAAVLGRYGTPAAIAALLEALKHKNELMRLAAAEALALNHGPAVSRALIETLQDPSPAVRAAAAEGLGKIGAEQAGNHLLTALQDPDWQVRRAAALALGSLQSKEAVQALRQVLHDSNRPVRWAAVRALSEYSLEGEALAQIVRALPRQQAGLLTFQTRLEEVQAARNGAEIPTRPVRSPVLRTVRFLLPFLVTFLVLALLAVGGFAVVLINNALGSPLPLDFQTGLYDQPVLLFSAIVVISVLVGVSVWWVRKARYP